MRLWFNRLLAGGLLLVTACVTPYTPENTAISPRLVVEGLITDQPGPHRVRLTTSAAFSNDNAGISLGLNGATVYASDDNGRRIEFFDSGGGNYLTATDFQGQVGRTYQLHIRTAEGTEYVSEPELLKPVPPIDDIYWEYNPANKSITVYLDLTDPPTPGDGYLWKWRHFSQLTYCKLSEEIPNSNGARTPCLNCCTDCWDINQCFTCVNIAGDQFVNGNKVRKQAVTTIPYDSRAPYYLLIEQRSLGNNAYRFWNSVRSQSNATGGPFDVPPAPTLGNIRNANNPNERVLGFFGASGVIYQPYWVDRSTIADSPAVPQPPDCPVIVGPPPPCFPCVEAFNQRTRTKPPGWDR
ncbi:MAG: DUF4249 domain-containing protein [Cytophagales bacterium]|nr:DUF4249 domain-containing protein [Cytophagales bacterium]